MSEAWREMEALQAEGKAKSIGVSNYAVLQLEETLKYAKVSHRWRLELGRKTHFILPFRSFRVSTK